MPDTKYDINFLRFLSKRLSSGIFDHNIAQCLFKRLSVDRIKKHIIDYFENNYKRNPKNLNIYIHIPYCAQVCSYCHCRTQKLSDAKQVSEYLSFLINQIYDFSRLFCDKEISSVWFGGGTPSLLNEKDIRKIFECLYSNFKFKDKIQVNFEASPSSLTKDKIRILKEYGLNRLTLGVQSLDALVLKEIGRAQNKRMVYECVEYIKNEKIPVLNIDLIAGLPGQTLDSFLNDLNTVIKLKPDTIHVNPLSDIFTSNYYQNKGFDIYKFVIKRHAMMIEAKKILENNGYKRDGFEAYQLNKRAYNFQQSDTVNNFSNIFAFGENTVSVIFDKLIYKCVNWECVSSGKAPEFKGTLIDERYAKARFMTWYLWKGFKNKDFHNIFGEEPENIFKEELAFLENLGLVNRKNGDIKYVSGGKMADLFDYFAYTNIFYGEEMLLSLKRHFKNYYSLKYKYNFLQDGFLPKINDHFFMLTYYDMGY